MKPPITVTLKLDQRTLPAQVFERYARREDSRKIRAIRAELAWENFGKPGRDPSTLGSVTALIANNGHWIPYLKIAQLRNHWDQVVGPVIAQHSQVIGLRDGVMTIRADSAAWATQLTYLIPQLERTIKERLQAACAAAVEDPDFVTFMNNGGYTIAYQNAEEYTAFLPVDG